MTALLLSSAGAAVGGFLGGPIGALLGRAAGALAGNAVDQRLFGNGAKRSVEGPRLSDLSVQGASEGEPIAKVYGRARIAGQMIWATRFEEDTTIETSGGKATSLAGNVGGSSTSTSYTYFANFAIGLCEGPIAHIGRIWADGKILNREALTFRIYKGNETQDPDPLIQAKQGTLDVPAYRGLAYIVFERLPIGAFGNRIPQLTFEIIRPIGQLEEQLRGVCLIPGATEFGYHTVPVTRRGALGDSVSENAHSGLARTDLLASLDELQALAPNLASVSVIVPWYGTDLRMGQCLVKPGVDNAVKTTTGATWSVSGLSRASAHVVSQVDGRAAFGGTPADASVIAAITELKSRGLAVTLTPFLLMDIPAGNTLPDPYTGAGSQPVFPWRGRITCAPAPGQAGTPDATSAINAQVNAFFGTVTPAHFIVTGSTVTYTGPAQFSYRRQVLHLAAMAKAAGGVAVFVIGSELKGMTRLRSAAQTYPVVAALVALAQDVRTLLGSSTKITYAADWTEYGAFTPPGSTDVLFPLDALWASSAIDAVGIDFYPPLTDWRDEETHLDGVIAADPLDAAYLQSRLNAGEAYDFYYASDEARAAQTRLPISDTAYGKPWTYRPKDIQNWWRNAHIERLSGTETGTPTAWTAQSKPVYFLETGIPAVDLGSNQPNVFPDAKSSEGALPYGAQGKRSDAVQRRALEAIHAFFDPTNINAATQNPLSTVYAGRMLDTSRTHVWAWDARPWPTFPSANDVWGDGDNWRTGHWLNGRLGSAPIDRLAALISSQFSGPLFDCAQLTSVATGYVIDRAMSGRAALEPLSAAFAVDIVESGNVLRCRPYALLKPDFTLARDECADDKQTEALSVTRAQETELPRAVQITVSDADMDFRRTTVNARLPVAKSDRELRQDFALVMPPEDAQASAEDVLHQAWIGRETIKFKLPLSALKYEPGDLIKIEDDARQLLCRITRIEQDSARRIEARAVESGLHARGALPPRQFVSARPQTYAAPHVLIMDLPTLTGEAPHQPYIAATASPWPGRLNVMKLSSGTYVNVAEITRRAMIGMTTTALNTGCVWRQIKAQSFDCVISSGTLQSVSDEALLEGGNLAAVQHSDGQWELIQFKNAEIIGTKAYRLSGLLRGQFGTETLAAYSIPSGANFVLVDSALVKLPVALSDIGREASFQIAPQGATSGDVATALTITPQAVGLLPFAPVQPRLSRSSSGVTLKFTRRTRLDGDSWELVDVPLNEASERYDVSVLNGGTIVRTFSTSTPSIFYSAAEEIADFGSAQFSLHFQIWQLSDVKGHGRVLDVTLST